MRKSTPTQRMRAVARDYYTYTRVPGALADVRWHGRMVFVTKRGEFVSPDAKTGRRVAATMADPTRNHDTTARRAVLKVAREFRMKGW